MAQNHVLWRLMSKFGPVFSALLVVHAITERMYEFVCMRACSHARGHFLTFNTTVLNVSKTTPQVLKCPGHKKIGMGPKFFETMLHNTVLWLW